MIFVLLFLVVVAAAIGLTLHVVPEHERAVVYRLGRLRGALGPGVVFAPRGIDQLKRVTTKVISQSVAVGDVVTLDGASPAVEAIVSFRVIDPERAVVTVDNYRVATGQAASAVLRAHLGSIRTDRLLHDLNALNGELTAAVDERTAAWGVTVERVEISDVRIPRTASEPSVDGGLRIDQPAEFGDF